MATSSKSPTTSSPPAVSPKPNAASGLSFSIEKILAKATSNKKCLSRCDDSSKDCDVISAPAGRVKDRSISSLPWLAYSRYCPPKIPRAKRRLNQNKRKSSGNPRVPFSTYQILKMEKQYSQGRYLSASEVAQISEELDLAQHRVKIWFQNRRAREKRTENEMKNCPALRRVVQSNSERC